MRLPAWKVLFGPVWRVWSAVSSHRAVLRTARHGGRLLPIAILLWVLRVSAVAAEPLPAGGGTATTAFGHPLVIGPALTALPAKLADPNWLVAWVLKPSRLHPASRMRDFNIRVDEAQAVAAYLYAQPPPAPTAGRGGNIDTGRRLFVSRGCRGCHTIGTEPPAQALAAPDLAGIGLKVRREWLIEWLRNPRAYDPHTPMPRVQLDDEDIRHLVAFLMSHRAGADVVARAPRFQPGIAPQHGREALRRFDCARCHVIAGFQAIESVRMWPVAPAACGQCHEPEGTSTPRRLDRVSEPVDEHQRILQNGRQLVAYYNCRGCHRIEGTGGEIAKHLAPGAFAPPMLDDVGARLPTPWLVEYLQKPVPLRPSQPMRMPDFGLSPAEATALVRYFEVLAKVPPAATTGATVGSTSGRTARTPVAPP